MSFRPTRHLFADHWEFLDDFDGSLAADVQDTDLAALQEVVCGELLLGSLEFEGTFHGNRRADNREVVLPIIQLDGIGDKEGLEQEILPKFLGGESGNGLGADGRDDLRGPAKIPETPWSVHFKKDPPPRSGG
jgi:hypothetical protein